MKIFDLTRLAVRNLKGRWAVLPVIGFAVAAFCLCFAGAILTTVQEEKAQPYELLLLAQDNAGITDSTIADILKIPDVKAATSILQVPVMVQTGEYTAQFTLTGMDAGYLEGVYIQGNVFHADSVMPYIVLSEAACKQFAKEEKDAGKETPDIDWVNAGYSLNIGEESRSVTSKACGILSDGGEKDAEPDAYVSLSVAKELLRESNQPTVAQVSWVRITNIGCADSVSKQIAALGLNVTNSNEQMQTEWDVEMKEMVYLLVIAVFCLICASLMLAANRAVTLERQKQAFEMLRWVGMKDRSISRLFMLHALIVSVFGALIGLVVSLSLPSFLPPELKGTSSYTLSVPFIVAAGSFGVCILLAVIPACFVKARQPSS